MDFLEHGNLDFGLLGLGPRLGRLRNFSLDLDFLDLDLDIVQVSEQVQFGLMSRKLGLHPLCFEPGGETLFETM